MKTIAVIGAGGGVGGAVAEQFLAAGYQVIAIARDTGKLAALEAAGARAMVGSVATEAAAAALRDQLPSIDGVVVSVNRSREERRLVDQSADWLIESLRDNLASHFIAAKTLIPVIQPGGLYLSIGGGSADFAWPGHGHISTSQAALRMMIQVVAKEFSSTPVHVRELMIYSMVRTRDMEAVTAPGWIDASAVGQRCVEILERPEEFAGPILRIPG